MTRLFDIGHTNYPKLFSCLHALGLEAVDLASWKSLQSAAQLMKTPEFATLKVRQRLDVLRQRWLQLPQERWKKVPHIMHWSYGLHPPYQHWQKKQITKFNNPLWWEDQFQKIKSLPAKEQKLKLRTLQNLKKDWFTQSQYAHYSTLDLLHVYEKVMPVFSEWLSYAQKEWQLKQGSISLSLKEKYENYLNWFGKALQDEKAQLRWCLYARLAIGVRQGNGQRDNVIENMQDELIKLGTSVLNPTVSTIRDQGHLTPHAFVRIRHLIECEGSEEEKKQLYGLAYDRRCQPHRPSLFQLYYRTNTAGGTYYIPSSLSSSLPAGLPFYLKLPQFLHVLFWKERFQYVFFQHPRCQFLLAQEHAFKTLSKDLPPMTIHTLAHEARWQQSQQCLIKCRAEKKRMEIWLSHPLLFFFPAMRQLLESYRTVLKKMAQQWMEQHIFLLDTVLSQDPKQDNVRLQMIIDDLEKTQQEWGLEEEMSCDLKSFKLRLNLSKSAHSLADLPMPLSLTTLPDVESLSLRDQFRETLFQSMYLFELTHGRPHPQIEALRQHLKMDALRYDSVALRQKCVQALTQITALPQALKEDIQSILAKSCFSEEALHHHEQSVLKSMCPSHPLEMEPLPLNETPYTVLEEDHWEDKPELLNQHLQSIQQCAAQHSRTQVTLWNQKICQYTLRFLKRIEALSDWDAFSLRASHILKVFQTLAEVSQTTFPVFHKILESLVTAQQGLEAKDWPEFLEMSIIFRIKTLEKFLESFEEPSLPLVENSYKSERFLAFLRPPQQTTSTPPFFTHHSSSTPSPYEDTHHAHS